MRELTIHELNHIQAGTCSTWEIAGFTFLATSVATGGIKLISTCSISQGLQVGFACGLVSMLGMYAAEDYDLAGFTVGIVEKSQVIDGKNIREGDKLIALSSSGAHSNGYSLIRHILKKSHTPLDMPFENQTIGQALLSPTKIYVKSILALAQAGILKGAAHITGGGLIENIPRILPNECAAYLDLCSESLPPLFHWLQEKGGLSDFELRRTFNCGVGMIICVDSSHQEQALDILSTHHEDAWVIGEIIPRASEAVVFSDEKF